MNHLLRVLALAALFLQPPATATDLVNQLQAILDQLRTSVFVSSHTVTVNVGESIQAAIDAAPDGTTIRIQPGAYAVNLILRANKSGIILRSDVADPVLVLPWVTPALVAGKLATLTPLDPSAPIIRTEAGAHDYTLRLLEIGPDLGNPAQALIYLGDFNQATLAQVPSHIDVDRCYIHGSDEKGGLRGISLNTRNSTVSGSYIANFWFRGADSQAIGIYTGPGPFLIEHNYLEGSGENLMAGGVDTKNGDMVPSDLVIRGNYFFKPLAWKTKPGSVKNLLELKHARRVLIENNVFEHSWIDAQAGHGVVFTVRDQDGTAPWTTVRDVVVRGNVIKDCQGAAFNLLGLDDSPIRPSVQGVNLTITGNLILNAARGLQSAAGYRPTVITHNTFLGITNAAAFLYGVPFASGSLQLADNVIAGGLYGVFGDGVGSGTAAFTTYAPGAVLSGNVLEGVGSYPSGVTLVAPGTVTISTAGGADVAAITRAIPWLTLP